MMIVMIVMILLHRPYLFQFELSFPHTMCSDHFCVLLTRRHSRRPRDSIWSD